MSRHRRISAWILMVLLSSCGPKAKLDNQSLVGVDNGFRQAPAIVQSVASAADAPSCELIVPEGDFNIGETLKIGFKKSGNISTASLDGEPIELTQNEIQISVAKKINVFRVEVEGPKGTSTCGALVTTANIDSKPPACDLAASPEEISAGGSVILTFTASSNATAASLGGVELSLPTATRTLSSLTETTEFVAEVSNAAGSSQCSALVKVSEVPAVLPPPGAGPPSAGPPGTAGLPKFVTVDCSATVTRSQRQTCHKSCSGTYESHWEEKSGGEAVGCNSSVVGNRLSCSAHLIDNSRGAGTCRCYMRCSLNSM